MVGRAQKLERERGNMKVKGVGSGEGGVVSPQPQSVFCPCFLFTFSPLSRSLEQAKINNDTVDIVDQSCLIYCFTNTLFLVK